ncbi:MAG: M1 family metallopeptidase, partial [Bacteroidota bacterium]
NGMATLELTPYFYTQDSLHLDAKGMLIRSVELHREGAAPTKLNYSYDGLLLHLQMDRAYRQGDTAKLVIDYQARPNEAPVGGSDAISADKGLYFINPDGKHPYKPRQIWTQGETEASSRWFPTIDQPNERTTQRMRITVDNKYTTLSNGILVQSDANADGTRTDIWVMDKPHAPYLFMMAVGEFAVVEDAWNGLPVNYYVEPEYGPYAQLIFGNTPEMMTLFSEKFGVKFPWPKYSQVVVRDFVSGAMENTTATIHMEQLQHDARAHLDETYEDYVSHELAHQWFGDLVTCESWANIAMNESFATYLEVLWREHKYGLNSADYHRFDQLSGYLQEAAGKREPLIRFHWDTQEGVFDRHSYNKGGTILHLLREVVGDEAFYASLRHYLEKKQWQAVESHDLRLSFEAVTGEDMNWFWNQWFFSAGHPSLEISYTVSDDTIRYHVAQTQNLEYQPLFRLPVTLSYVAGGKERTQRHWMHTQDTTFVINTGIDSADIQLVEVDPLLVIPSSRSENKAFTYWKNQLNKTALLKDPEARTYHSQRLASSELAQTHEPQDYLETLVAVTKGAQWWEHRLRALEQIGRLDSLESNPEMLALLKKHAADDPEAAVRASAYSILTGLDSLDKTEMVAFFEAGALNDSSYAAAASALNGLYLLDSQKGLAVAKSMRKWENIDIAYQVSDILMLENAREAPQYIHKQLLKLPGGFLKMLMMDRAADYALHVPDDRRGTAIKYVTEALLFLAEHGQPWYERYGALQALGKMEGDVEQLTALLDKLEEKEANERVQSWYEQRRVQKTVEAEQKASESESTDD